jgi:hypothetical protein
MRRRFEKILCPLGRLKRRYRLAICLDSSVLIEYWLAEGWEPWDMVRPFRRPRAWKCRKEFDEQM